jgi:SNF family Na+-dependent transporter
MFASVDLAFVFIYDYGGAAPRAQVLRQNGGKSMFASSSVSRLAGFLVFNIGTLHRYTTPTFL